MCKTGAFSPEKKNLAQRQKFTYLEDPGMNVPPNYKHHLKKTVKLKTRHVPGGVLISTGVLILPGKVLQLRGV